jgi:hypothetical protein
MPMKNVVFAVILLVVAGGAYQFGRRQGLHAISAQTSAPIISPAAGDHGATSSRGGESFSNNRNTDARNYGHPDSSAPFAQNMTAAQRGYEAARSDLAAALKQIESLPVSERMGFITGVFSFVAKNQSPADSLKTYQQVPEAFRPNALRALVAEWINSRSPLDEDMRYLKREGTLTISGSRLGLEVELTSMLASTQPDAELTTAWLDAFSTHSSRSEIFSILSGRPALSDPDSVLSRTEAWTPWEKERVTKTFLSNWSYGAPQEAWNWYESRRDRFDQDFSSSIIGPWASSDPDGVKRLLETLKDPGQRATAISAVGKVLGEKNTDEAVSWAEGIADAREREIAQRAVYDGAPRGIGAVLDFDKGFPKLRGIVPGSPLEGTGAKPGDQILEVREANGTSYPLYGRDIQTAVNLIRGEAGTQMALRVLRQNGTTGEFEEHLIPVTRGQLYLNEKSVPTPAATP